MKIAAALALRDLAKLPVPAEVAAAYGVDSLEFGREYIIPKPMDPRLITLVSDAVARRRSSGVATLPYPSHYPLQSVAIQWLIRSEKNPAEAGFLLRSPPLDQNRSSGAASSAGSGLPGAW